MTKFAGIGFMVVGAMLALVGSVSAAQPGTCSKGFELVSVAQAEGEGYAPVPRREDENGNRDGWVCRRALGDGVAHKYPGRPDTLYLWADNVPGGAS